MTFTSKVLECVRNIPRGRVASYGAIALLAGSPGAARAVGTIMKNNKDKNVPCHRVVCTDGRIGGYNGNLGVKIDLLKSEGVEIENDRVKETIINSKFNKKKHSPKIRLFGPFS